MPRMVITICKSNKMCIFKQIWWGQGTGTEKIINHLNLAIDNTESYSTFITMINKPKRCSILFSMFMFMPVK